MNAGNVLVIGSQELRTLLSIKDCIEVVEDAFRIYGEGKAISPIAVGLHAKTGGFHIKAGILDRQRSYFAAKVNGNFPNNPTQFGLPTIQGLIVLCDADKGTPLAIMDSREITSLRTAAATAIAAKYLARPDSTTLTICGCGNQARFQLAALSYLVSFRTIFAFDQSEDQISRFAAMVKDDLDISVTPVNDLRAALRMSDICVTCTSSEKAIVDADDVAPGTFIAAVGADNSSKQELTPQLMARGKIVCDVLEQCMVMGDLHHALDAGVVVQSYVFAELGEIVAGKKPGRQSSEEITIFDSTGMALQDVAAATLAFEKAQHLGVGTALRIAA
jgi:ornithine cyclodeaminase/alanine dehydrogenase